MPMIPETLVAMLACARIGAVHSVVFGGFAPHELAIRIDDAQPRVVISASCGIEGQRVIEYKPFLDAAIAEAENKPERCVIFQRPQATAALAHRDLDWGEVTTTASPAARGGRDLDWGEVMTTASPADCVPVQATDPLYILYTSGTTGKPKGVVRDNGGHAVALHWTICLLYTSPSPRDS